jgi:predicted nucleic acid-binding protein
VKYYDTSALLRAWKEGWMPIEGMTRSHTVAEWISVQTGRGLVYREPDGQLVKRNLSLTDAAREAQRVFAYLVFRDLSGPQTLEATVLASARDGTRGSNFHDFLHARTAEAYGATSIVTLNMADFRNMTSLPLEHPLQP